MKYNNIPCISIIVPIYNSEKWLKQCLYSLYKQTITNIEIICINDGSTDSSREIIKQFSSKDPRFILVDSLNIGVTKARKLAMSIAKGKYIGFVDSDDYVTDDYFEKLYEKATLLDADIAITTRQLRFSPTNKFFASFGNDIYGEASIIDRLSHIKSGTIWNKIYKRDFAIFISNEFYINTCQVCEDNAFTIFAIILAKKIVTINSVCYFYRQNENSITHKQPSQQMIYDIYYAFESILNKFNSLINSLPKNNLELEHKYDINYKMCLSYAKKYIKLIKSRQQRDCYYKLYVLSYYKQFLIIKNLKDIAFTYNYIKYICDNILKKLKDKTKRLLYKYNTSYCLAKKIKSFITIYKTKKSGQYCDISKISFYNIKKNIVNNSSNSSPELIVSLTSYPERIEQVCYTLHSLLNQSIHPDKIELWLSEEEFSKTYKFPDNLLILQDCGIEICWTKSNIRSYKKIIPCIKKHPEAIIVTADDDIYYHNNWLKDLYNTWQTSKELHIIPCYRMHKILLENNFPLPYEYWLHVIQNNKPNIRHLPTGCGGVLYPPHCFYLDITREDIFLKLAPTADDLWLWAMTSLNGWHAVSVSSYNISLSYTDILMEYNLNHKKALVHTNIGQKKNDVQFTNILKQYPELLYKLNNN